MACSWAVAFDGPGMCHGHVRARVDPIRVLTGAAGRVFGIILLERVMDSSEKDEPPPGRLAKLWHAVTVVEPGHCAVSSVFGHTP